MSRKGNQRATDLSLIKSRQTGEITIAAGASSGTATINQVDMTKCLRLFNGWRSADTTFSSNQDYPYISLLDSGLGISTKVRAVTSAVNSTNDRIIRFTIVEFYPFAVQSVQQDAIQLVSVATHDESITSVDTTRSFAVHLGQSHGSSGSNDFNYNQAHINLQSATTVRITKDNVNFGPITVSFAVIQFRPGILKSVQPLSITIAAGTTSTNQAITAVNDTAAMLVWGGFILNAFAGNSETFMPHVFRTSTTNVRAARTGLNNFVNIVNCTVVEFYPRWVKSRQAAQTTIGSGAASGNAAISAVVLNKSLISWLGNTCSADVSGDEAAYTTAKIDTTTQVTIERGGSPANTVTTSWEVVEFY